VEAWVLKKLSLSIRPFYKSSVGISSIILMVCVAECLKRFISTQTEFVKAKGGSLLDMTE